MDDEKLKKLRPHLWVFAALLLVFDVVSCTRETLSLARQGFHWGWWNWTPCFYNIYLLIEVILSKNKSALITACTLLFFEFAADICFLFGWRVVSAGWPYVLLNLAGAIALLIVEDNGFLKKANLAAIVITLVAVCSVHL